MAIKPVICGGPAVYVPECDPCDMFEERVEALEECCDEARATLADHEQRITDNANDIADLQQNLADNYYTKSETYNQTEVDTFIGGVSSEIQNINNNFSNYYTKTETYTQSQVDHLIQQVQGGKYVEVDTLPATGADQTIYLVPGDTPGTKEQWIYSDGQWINIGSTSVDMSQYVHKNEIVDMIHPVGDTVIRTDNVDPGTLYSGTTWQLISEGRMIIGADSTYALGTTGGSADAIVVSHNHNQNAHSHTQNAHTHIQNSHYHFAADNENFRFLNFYNGSGVGINVDYADDIPNGNQTRAYPRISNTGSNRWGSQSNTKAATATNQNATATNQNTTATNIATGESGTGKNMPPYLAVNIWIRTA